MDAIRKRKVKRTGKQIIIDLPENFKAEEVDLIIWPSTEENERSAGSKLNEWRNEMALFYSKFNVDLSGFNFDREGLYDRP